MQHILSRAQHRHGSVNTACGNAQGCEADRCTTATPLPLYCVRKPTTMLSHAVDGSLTATPHAHCVFCPAVARGGWRQLLQSGPGRHAPAAAIRNQPKGQLEPKWSGCITAPAAINELAIHASSSAICSTGSSVSRPKSRVGSWATGSSDYRNGTITCQARSTAAVVCSRACRNSCTSSARRRGSRAGSCCGRHSSACRSSSSTTAYRDYGSRCRRDNGPTR